MPAISSPRFGSIEVERHQVLAVPPSLQDGWDVCEIALVAPRADSVVIWAHDMAGTGGARPFALPWTVDPDFCLSVQRGVAVALDGDPEIAYCPLIGPPETGWSIDLGRALAVAPDRMRAGFVRTDYRGPSPRRLRIENGGVPIAVRGPVPEYVVVLA